MEKVRPWCGQPSDRGQLKNRGTGVSVGLELIKVSHSDLYILVVFAVWRSIQETAYCYNGQCRSHRSQCRLWWGGDADNAADDCYTLINVLGGYAANCGYNFTANAVFPCSHRYTAGLAFV